MSALKIGINNFENEIIKSEKTVLLDFFAERCPACKTISPIIDEIADENPQYLIGKVNVDKEPDLTLEFGISSVPTLVAIKNGKVLSRSSGAKTKEKILSMLKD
ncbi:MAG: thioredoxin family protein [Clostridia bacterium]|nr:thioredoxin family protein [Clostridia bacterium]